MKLILTTLLVLTVSACAGKKALKTSNAQTELEQRYAEKIGSATKGEFVEEFGNAAWCEPKAGGGETCRFYKSLGIQWRGDKENRSKYEAYDEVVAEFDSLGKLREYTAKAQR